MAIATFRERVKAYMNYMADMKQIRLAEILKTSRKTVNGYLSEAKESTPTFSDLLHIADTLGLSLDWLTGRATAPMWSPDIQNARVWLRGQLDRVPGANDKHFPFDRRIAAVLGIMAEQVPQLTQAWFVAGMLGIPLEAYERFAAGTGTVTDTMLQRAAAFTDLPERWLMSGGDDHLTAPDNLGEYSGVVARWARQGVTADRLEEVEPLVTRMALQS